MATATFSDNFNRADNVSLGNGWTDAYFFPDVGPEDHFSIVTNKAQGKGLTLLTQHSGALAPMDAFFDWDLSCDITHQAGLTVTSGLICRAQSANDFYWCMIFDGGIELRKRISGATTILTSTVLAWPVGNTKSLRFTVIGSTLTCYISGVQQSTIVDTDLVGAGTCGMHHFGQAADISTFDDFSATGTTITLSVPAGSPSNVTGVGGGPIPFPAYARYKNIRQAVLTYNSLKLTP